MQGFLEGFTGSGTAIALVFFFILYIAEKPSVVHPLGSVLFRVAAAFVVDSLLLLRGRIRGASFSFDGLYFCDSER